jgi:hypothetical protein
MESKKTMSMVFSCLIKKDGPLFIGHCLELDIVSSAKSMAEVKSNLKDLIMAQVDYAFSNKNLDNLYHPAPTEVWEEFYKCKSAKEERFKIDPSYKKKPDVFVPPWIIAKTCMTGEACRV